MIKDLFQFIHSLGLTIHRKLWFGVACSILTSVLIVPVGFLIQKIFDEAVPSSDLKLLFLLSGIAIGLTCLNGFLSVVTRNFILRITKEATFQIRSALVKKLLYASHHFTLNQDHSRVHKIAVYNTEKIDMLFNSLFSVLVPSVLVSLPLITFLLFLDWAMGFSFLVLSAIGLWIINRVRDSKKKKVILFQEMFQIFHTKMLFLLEFNKLIKTSSSQIVELKSQTENLRKLNSANLEMIDGFTKMSYYQDLVFSLISILLLAIGGYRVIQGAMTLGVLVFFYFCLYLLKKYLSNISNGMPLIIEGSHALTEYQELTSSVNEEPYHGEKQIHFKGNIELKKISFSFSTIKLIENFDLRLAPGKITLLQGPNGSGKSTLVSLILGLFKPDEGTLLADGVEYTDLDISHFRSQVSVVFQENTAFNGTLRDNLCYGKTSFSDKLLLQVAQAAILDEFITSLPDGLDTLIGDKGMKLSGGQRQKMAIARCFLSQSGLIIMDEPTNHLDNDSILSVIDSLRMLDHRPAILLISHNGSLSEVADEVCTLNIPRYDAAF